MKKHSLTRSSRSPFNRANLAVLILLICASIAFAVLAFAAHNAPYFSFDLEIARRVQGIDTAWFDALMKLVGWPGYPPQVYVVVVLLFLLIWFLVSKWAAVTLAVATFGIGALGLLFKILVNRPRPDPALIHVMNPNLDGGKYSFTAGHVESYIVIFGFIFFLAYISQNHSWMRSLVMIICAVLIVLIGPSRIYSGEHWASDIIGGYLLGIIGLVLTIWFYQWGVARHFLESRAKRRDSSAVQKEPLGTTGS